MNSKKEIDFNFQILEKKNLDLSGLTKNNLDTTILDTISIQLSTMITYSILLFIMLKFFSVDLTSLAFFILRFALITNAISQAYKYSKIKDLKNQLANGITNIGVLVYIFYGNGFETINQFTNKILGYIF